MKKFILALILLAAPAAHALDSFTDVWLIPTSEVLATYLQFDDKSEADRFLDSWIDGAVAGVLFTYNYGAGVETTTALYACIGESDYSPSYLRKKLLAAGSDPQLGTVTAGTYLYAAIHLKCASVLGEYETAEDRAGTSS